MKLRCLLAVGAVAVVAAIAGFQVGQVQRNAAAASAASLKPLLEASLFDLDGKARKLSDWRGKPLVINFWATWCPPCREEMPELSNYQARLGESKVQFIGIAIDDAESVKAFARSTPVQYPLLIATPAMLGLTAKHGNANQGLPFTLAVDGDGRLLWSKLGRLSAQEMDAKLLPFAANNH